VALGTFVSLDRAHLIPDDNADPATRGALTTAGRLLSRYDQLQRAVEANELVVFDAAFNTLWDPKNAQKDDSQLYTGVGKKYGLSGPEVSSGEDRSGGGTDGAGALRRERGRELVSRFNSNGAPKFLA
jgi:hypothetical protein